MTSNIKNKSQKILSDLITLTSISVFIIILLGLFSDDNIFNLIIEFFRPFWEGFEPLWKEDEISNVTVSYIFDIIVKSSPLWLTALAFSIPFQTGYYNIGAEGQLFLSSFVAILSLDILYKSIYYDVLPTSLLMIISIFLAVVAGILWALVPFYLKRFSKVNEVITTLVLNALAASIIIYCLNWADLGSESAQGIQSKKLDSSLHLSTWDFGVDAIVTIIIPISLFLLLISKFWVWKTHSGLHLRAIGKNRDAAKFIGININNTILVSVILAGCFSGIAGLNSTLGEGRFSIETLSGIGFDGIIVAILGNFTATGILIASIFIILWDHFSQSLQFAGFPDTIYMCAKALFLVVFLFKNRL